MKRSQMPENLKYANTTLELKQLEERQFEGYGSVFNNLDLQDDIIVPGAFKRSLATHKKEGTTPQMFWMHAWDQVPGKWLDMAEDDYGLKVKGELLPTTLGKDMHVLLTNDAVRGLSIGFRIMDYDFDDDGVRIIKEIDLWEVSLVSLAANPLAQVASAKAARLSDTGEWVPRPKDFEKFLREVGGYSRDVAKGITAKVFGGDGGKPDTAAAGSGEDKEMDELKQLLGDFDQSMELTILGSSLK